MLRSTPISHARFVTLAGVVLAAGACSSASNPIAPQQSRVDRPAAPDFVYVSDASGTPQLYRYGAAGSVRLTFDNSTDDHPNSEAGRLVFTSYRDGDGEIYVASIDGSSAHRLTHSAGLDDEAALDPSGARIVFVSARNGATRLFTMDTAGNNQVALATGSSSWVPERAPAWSPDGSKIAFTSTRTSTSQVFIVPAAGGDAVQVTHEAGGAFDPTWSADGSKVYFVSASGTPYLRVLDVATGTTSDFERDSTALGQPACSAAVCLAVSDAYGPTGQIVSYSTEGGAAMPVVSTAANATSPALIVP